MFKPIYFIVLIGIINSGSSTLVPFLKKCKLDDSKCIKDTTQATIPLFAAGLPELGVETLDPCFIKRLDADTPGLKLHLTDITLNGLKGCAAKKMEFDSSKSKLSVKLLCSVNAVGQYDMNGQVLVLPIEGKGEVRVNLKKVVIAAEADIVDSVGKDGKKHWEIKDWTHSYSLKDKSSIEFDNLFNGNEVLGRAAREIISSNSNELIAEIGPPVIKAIAKKIVDNVKMFFKNVPFEDLVM